MANKAKEQKQSTHKKEIKKIRKNKKRRNTNRNDKGSKRSHMYQRLNAFSREIIGRGCNWKKVLNKIRKGMTEYEEFLSRSKASCDSLGSHYRGCPECFIDLKLKNWLVSHLIELIRNVHEHALEKIRHHRRGILNKMFPNGYEDKDAFVDYWMAKFPKLFHVIAALVNNHIHWFNWKKASMPDQVVDKLVDAVNYERDHGNKKNLMNCVSITLITGFHFHAFDRQS